MATEAQISANRENAQHSTGPKTEEGKANSCQNNFRWGFTGGFAVLPSESQEDFDDLHAALRHEHRPSTPTEEILVEKMTQAHWLSRRAQWLQDGAMIDQQSLRDQERQFALFLRYQIANDRAFQRCLHDLLKLRSERRKAEIGFESQKDQNRAREQAEIRAQARTETQQSRDREGAVARQAAETRRAAAETRKQECHKFAISLADAKLDHQIILNSQLNPMIPATVHMEKAA